MIATWRDAGEKFWEDTAIVVTWDDRGGWSDHQPARYASKLPCKSTHCQADYQYGFRVPLIVVSAYTPKGYVDNRSPRFRQRVAADLLYGKAPLSSGESTRSAGNRVDFRDPDDSRTSGLHSGSLLNGLLA